MAIDARLARMCAVAFLTTLVAACGGGGGGSGERSEVAPGNGSTNQVPVISGRPDTTVRAGETYAFQPSARDPEGAALTFSISNLPSWARFDSSTGRLTGTPTASDVGTYSGLVIAASDGAGTARLGPFTIRVVEVGTGAATLTWTPPTENTDGSALRDLAGYRVLYGRAPDHLSQSVDISDPSLSAYMVENLTPGTWYFTVVAFNSRGASSDPSNITSKTVG